MKFDFSKFTLAKVFLVFSACAFLGALHVSSARATTLDDLRRMINEKNSALEQVNTKIRETNKALNETQNQSKTLTKEISNINGNINQLNLSIRSSELSVEKLGLELESLNYDIHDVQTTITKNKGAIGEVLRGIQQKDSENFLALLLRNKSLAEGVLEMQNLVDFNSNLSLQIANLKALQGQLSQKVDDASKKQEQVKQESENLKSRKEIVADQKREKDFLLQQTKNKESLYQKQLDELESQQEQISQEIGDLENELRKSFDPSILPIKRPGVLAYPVQDTTLSQGYGDTSFAKRAYRTQFHNGIDFPVGIGTPVFAAEDGEVIAADNNDQSRWRKYQYGRYILIQHDNNLATIYAHLSQQIVRKGDAVKRGDLIGYSGNTGYATGPHLHFGVYWAPSITLKSISPAAGLVPVGVTINPQDYL